MSLTLNSANTTAAMTRRSMRVRSSRAPWEGPRGARRRPARRPPVPSLTMSILLWLIASSPDLARGGPARALGVECCLENHRGRGLVDDRALAGARPPALPQLTVSSHRRHALVDKPNGHRGDRVAEIGGEGANLDSR